MSSNPDHAYPRIDYHLRQTLDIANQYTKSDDFSFSHYAFDALILLAGHKEELLASKNQVIRCWHCYQSGVICIS